MLNNDDLAMIMQAIAETPQFQFLSQLMASEGAEEDPLAQPDEGLEAPPVEAPMEEPPMEEAPPMEAPPEEAPPMEAPPEEAIPQEEEPEQNVAPALAAAAGTVGKAALGGAGRALASPTGTALATGYLGGVAARRSQAANGDQPDRYSQLHAAHEQLVGEHGKLAAQFDGLLREKADAQRTSALQGLSSRYPNFVDLESELSATLYSQQSQMNDEAFEAHCAHLERYAQRAEAMARTTRPDIPAGVVDRQVPAAQSDQYGAKLANEAVRIYTESLGSGEQLTYSQAKEKAQQTLSS